VCEWVQRWAVGCGMDYNGNRGSVSGYSAGLWAMGLAVTGTPMSEGRVLDCGLWGGL